MQDASQLQINNQDILPLLISKVDDIEKLLSGNKNVSSSEVTTKSERMFPESYDWKNYRFIYPLSKQQSLAMQGSAIRTTEFFTSYHSLLENHSALDFWEGDIRIEVKTENYLGKNFSDRLLKLQKNIGKTLFNQLSYEQKLLMANTFGRVNLGSKINIKQISY